MTSTATHTCPNCEALVEEKAVTCPTCMADFGPQSSWKPVVASTRKRERKTREVEDQPGGIWKKLIGTLWLVGWVPVLVFFLPMGRELGMLLLFFYLTTTPWALYRLWQRGTYSTLFLFLGLFPIFWPFLAIAAFLLGAVVG